jgi:hypothetical protein
MRNSEFNSDQPFAGTYRSSDEILAHPRFPDALTGFIEAVLRLYENDPFLTRLLLEAGRQVMFSIIICLHARYDEADRATWPTMGLLQQSMTQFGLSSPRRIEALVARLIRFGFLESVAAKSDRRVRILTPTAKMFDHDLDWLAAHYLPLHAMFPDAGYAPAIKREPSFQRAQRLAAIGFFGLGAEILASNQAMMLFLSRDAGVMILMKLIQMAGVGNGKSPTGLSYDDIGFRFGVSRTHVRQTLRDAEQAGLVGLSGRGGRLVELMPSVRQAFARFVADSMSGHDLLFQIARKQMTG